LEKEKINMLILEVGATEKFRRLPADG